jgi:MFS family permease
VINAPARAKGPYRELLAQRALRRLAAADACARLPQGMMSLTVLLVAAQHAPMAVAGLALAGHTLGAAATAPLRGRLADRRGLFAVSAACGIGYVLAMLGLLTASLARAPGWLLIVTAGAAGLTLPPVSPGVRSLWAACAQPRLRRAAFALDAAVFDFSFIAGPVLASALSAGLAPAAALCLVLILTWAAILAVGSQARLLASRDGGGDSDDRVDRGDRVDRVGRDLLGPLRSAVLRRLLVTAALANAALSATEVSLTAYARLHHALWASGLLLAAISAGSITGSLLLGARTPQGGRSARLSLLLLGYTAGLAALAAASLFPPLLAVAAPLAGLCLGPALATLFSAAGSAAPRGNGAEAQAWINSIMNGGAACGAALAGFTAGQPIFGLVIAAAAACAAAASSVVAAPSRGHSDDARAVRAQIPVLPHQTRK